MTMAKKEEKKNVEVNRSYPEGYMILYHKSNLVYTGFFPQLLSFEENNSVETSILIFFTEKQLCKLICSYGKVSHPLKAMKLLGT